MICVQRLNGKQYYVNADLIMTVESIPDTVMTLTTGDKFIVRDTIAEVCKKIVEYRYLCCNGFTAAQRSES